jgi:hypothetical protein
MTTTIFDFETDFAGSLRCIPMSVRFKLDHCGVKLSLKQWSQFAREDRAHLLAMSCDTAEHDQSYRQHLTALIEARTGDKAKHIAVESNPEWGDVTRVPEQLSAYMTALGMRPLSLPQWAGLAPLRRFVLLKLSRAAHDNDNFLPALREFGLSS